MGENFNFQKMFRKLAPTGGRFPNRMLGMGVNHLFEIVQFVIFSSDPAVDRLEPIR
jgi:hypothetical protein